MYVQINNIHNILGRLYLRQALNNSGKELDHLSIYGIVSTWYGTVSTGYGMMLACGTVWFVQITVHSLHGTLHGLSSLVSMK